GVDPDADAHLQLLARRSLPERALDRERRVERAHRLAEDAEELVRTRVDLVAVRVADGLPDERTDVAEQRRVPIAEPLRQARRPLDVGEEERHGPLRQHRDARRAGLDLALLALLAELPVEEAERNDVVLLRRAKQALAGPFARGGVLETRLFEAGEGVPHVRRVVDRKAPLPPRIDVGERAIRQARTGLGIEHCHRFGLLGETHRNDGATLAPWRNVASRSRRRCRRTPRRGTSGGGASTRRCSSPRPAAASATARTTASRSASSSTSAVVRSRCSTSRSA